MATTAVLLGVGLAEKDARAMDEGAAPLTEFAAIARATGADEVSFLKDVLPRAPVLSGLSLRLKKVLSALVFVLRRNRYRSVYVTGEDIGIPLAVFLRFSGWRGGVVCVVHAATTQRSWFLLNLSGLRVFDRLICVSSAQRALLLAHTFARPDQVEFHYNWIDTSFFHPVDAAPSDYILSCGMENRDYQTLAGALAEIRRPAKIVASGFHGALTGPLAQGLQALGDVEVLSRLPFTELAALYRNARFVVVPLNPVDYAAGVTGLLEAMASGKAVIVSDSPGIREYVKDGESGYVVACKDPGALAAAIERLWRSPDVAAAMGRRNRAWVLENAGVEAYAAKIAAVMTAQRR